MSEPRSNPPQQSKTVQVCAFLFLIIGIVIYQFVAPELFPNPPGGGFNVPRLIWAAVVGGVSAVLGMFVGILVDKARGA
jgi:hypothetical protein